MNLAPKRKLLSTGYMQIGMQLPTSSSNWPMQEEIVPMKAQPVDVGSANGLFNFPTKFWRHAFITPLTAKLPPLVIGVASGLIPLS
jgi:hypothetical protein